MSSPAVPLPVVKPKALNCPNCGAAVEIRGFAHALNVVCPNCLSVLDATTPELAILQKFHAKQRYQPLIALGSRGTLRGVTYELIGFQVREVADDDDAYHWSEYLLFNPFQGFRYLSEYNGHWNFIRTLRVLPRVTNATAVVYNGLTYRHSDQSAPTTTFVLGEIPWQVRVGDKAVTHDYVSAQWMLSSDETDNEVTWSQGEYCSGTQIWEAFGLRTLPPAAEGIFANQPSNLGKGLGAAWKRYGLFLIALLLLAAIHGVTSARKTVFDQKYTFTQGSGEPSFVTPEFELDRPTNLRVSVQTGLKNDWAFFGLALIDSTSGHTRDFGFEIQNAPDEGSPNKSVTLPKLEPGKYYLRVEHEKDPGTSVSYDLRIQAGVPSYGWFWLAAFLLLIPPVMATIRYSSFEVKRKQL